MIVWMHSWIVKQYLKGKPIVSPAEYDRRTRFNLKVLGEDYE